MRIYNFFINIFMFISNLSLFLRLNNERSYEPSNMNILFVKNKIKFIYQKEKGKVLFKYLSRSFILSGPL